MYQMSYLYQISFHEGLEGDSNGVCIHTKFNQLELKNLDKEQNRKDRH